MESVKFGYRLVLSEASGFGLLWWRILYFVSGELVKRCDVEPAAAAAQHDGAGRIKLLLISDIIICHGYPRREAAYVSCSSNLYSNFVLGSNRILVDVPPLEELHEDKVKAAREWQVSLKIILVTDDLTLLSSYIF